jgi:Tfp pilus assembly protein PilF
MIRPLLTTLVALALLTSCASDSLRDTWEELVHPTKGQPALRAGLGQYDEGNYGEAARNLQAALERGLSQRQQATAYKHLGFIQCAWGQEKQCRDEFRKALTADPTLQLAPEEAGHPVWGRVFKAVKAGR